MWRLAEIGEPKRTIIVEPIEVPTPIRVPAPAPIPEPVPA